MRRFLCYGLIALSFSRACHEVSAQDAVKPLPLDYIDTSFDNASTLWYEIDAEGVIRLRLTYDQERQSSNRAAGHFHFRIHAKPESKLTLEFENIEDVYNGKKGSIARELKVVSISVDGKQWTPIATKILPGNRVQLELTMPGPSLYVARVEPYRLSDLERWLNTIQKHPQVCIETIGKTVEGRTLEIVRIGSENAPNRVFMRARAHPWEAGGSWVVQGLADRLLRDDAEAQKYLQRYAVYLMPMANKDGVARGRSRFNSNGKDLNRNWDKPADPLLVPENHALEAWLEAMIRKGRAPHLALEMHNDGNGMLHMSRPPVKELDRYLARMETFEKLLRQHTWFTEGSTQATFRNAGTLGEGWLERYGIDAAVHELNCQWIAGLQEPPTSRHWRRYGEQLSRVFDAYFGEGQKP